MEIDDEEMELGIVEAELSRPEEEKESGKKFYQGREFMEATGLRPDYYTQEEVDAAMEARGSKTEAAALEEAQPTLEQESAELRPQEAKQEEEPVKQTNKKDEKEPVLEGVQGRRDEGEGRKESAELRTQEAKQEKVAPPLSEQGKADVGGSNTPTVSDFEAISAKGEKGRKARAELTKRLGKDTVNDITRITANFESIINNLENQGKIRKECP